MVTFFSNLYYPRIPSYPSPPRTKATTTLQISDQTSSLIRLGTLPLRRNFYSKSLLCNEWNPKGFMTIMIMDSPPSSRKQYYISLLSNAHSLSYLSRTRTHHNSHKPCCMFCSLLIFIGFHKAVFVVAAMSFLLFIFSSFLCLFLSISCLTTLLSSIS